MGRGRGGGCLAKETRDGREHGLDTGSNANGELLVVGVGGEEKRGQGGLEGLEKHAGGDLAEEIPVADRPDPRFRGLGEGEEDAAGEDGVVGGGRSTLGEGDDDGLDKEQREVGGRPHHGEQELTCAPPPLV